MLGSWLSIDGDEPDPRRSPGTQLGLPLRARSRCSIDDRLLGRRGRNGVDAPLFAALGVTRRATATSIEPSCSYARSRAGDQVFVQVLRRRERRSAGIGKVKIRAILDQLCRPYASEIVTSRRLAQIIRAGRFVAFAPALGTFAPASPTSSPASAWHNPHPAGRPSSRGVLHQAVADLEAAICPLASREHE